jgi:hypothetical protein
LFVVGGVYASIAGFSLPWASGIALALVAGFLIRWRVREPTADHPLALGPASKNDGILLATLLILSAAVAMLLPNDVNNTDAARQVASIEHVTFYHTLLTPGFFAGDGTKYDGWTFLHAAVSQVSGEAPHLLVRNSKLILLPVFVASVYALVRLLDLGAVHVVAAIGLMLVFSGDSFRLISLGGPRSWAYALQILGLVHLLAIVKRGDRRPAHGAAARCGLFLAASSIVHLFFALTNSLIVALTCALAAFSGERRRLMPAALTLGVTFAILLGPYAYAKRAAVPEENRQLLPDTVRLQAAQEAVEEDPDASDPARRHLALGALFSLRWGEYGSLIPFLVAPLLWGIGARPREVLTLYLVLFALPCVALTIPQVYRAIIGVINEARLYRILPLSPAVMAIVAYGWHVQALSRLPRGPRRFVAALVLAVSAAAIVPAGVSAWRWYATVYPSTIPIRASDHRYVSVGLLLRLGTEGWPPVLATTRDLAVELASTTRRRVAFEVDGQRRWATDVDTFVDDDQSPIQWDFVVKGVTDADPESAACAEVLYTAELTLCATERGRSIWSYPGVRRASLAR